MSPRTDSRRSGAILAVIDSVDLYLGLYGADLAKETPLSARLEAYGRAIGETHERMHALGVVATCSLCDSREKGSCCFEGVECWYELELLLINRLMGIDLPRRREAPGQCLFLGRTGCKLRARYAFCVNFLCPALRNELGDAGTRELLATVGRELLLGLEAEGFLRRWLAARNDPA